MLLCIERVQKKGFSWKKWGDRKVSIYFVRGKPPFPFHHHYRQTISERSLNPVYCVKETNENKISYTEKEGISNIMFGKITHKL